MRTAAGLVVLALLFAGCSGESGGPSGVQPTGESVPPAEPAEVTDTEGAIQGAVLSEENLPIQGADVGILETGNRTLTDEGGRFSFSFLTPGTYTLQISSLGYSSFGRRVDVVAGEVASVSAVLIAIPPPDVGYHYTLQQRGLLGCAFVVTGPPEVGGTGLSACGAAAIVGLVTGQDTTSIDHFALFWFPQDPTTNWNTSVLEMVWQTTQVAGSGLNVYWEVNTCSGGGSDFTFGFAAGRSPLMIRVDEAKLHSIVNASMKPDNCLAQGLVAFDTTDICNEEHCEMQTRVFVDPETTQQAVDLGVAIQQPFDQFITNFYAEAPPEGFTALEDA